MPASTAARRSGIASSARGSARDYYTDLPFLALWGDRMFDRISSIDRYFEDAENGTLPNVVMVDPGFVGPDRSDNHPHGDIRMAQRFLHAVFSAFARSPQWHHGLFVVTYDEWGGFFDHVRPPVVADDRASAVDVENFGQTGFRVPTVLASPFAPRATWTRRSTTTRRSCASSSGGSSARRPRASTRRTAVGT